MYYFDIERIKEKFKYEIKDNLFYFYVELGSKVDNNYCQIQVIGLVPPEGFENYFIPISSEIVELTNKKDTISYQIEFKEQMMNLSIPIPEITLEKKSYIGIAYKYNVPIEEKYYPIVFDPTKKYTPTFIEKTEYKWKYYFEINGGKYIAAGDPVRDLVNGKTQEKLNDILFNLNEIRGKVRNEGEYCIGIYKGYMGIWKVPNE